MTAAPSAPTTTAAVRCRDVMAAPSAGLRGPVLQVLDSVEVAASGPSQSVPRLCTALAESGADVRLLTIGASPVPGRIWRHQVFAHDFASVPVLRRLRFSRGLAAALLAQAREASVIHAHGLWLMAILYPAQAARRGATPLILSPRGMLATAALGYSTRKKAALWALAQGRAARAAQCLHATSEQEYRDIRAFGLTAPIAIIPNGIDVAPPASKPLRQPGERTLLYLGRLHPQKGLDDLIEAWRRVALRHAGWRLVIAGPKNSAYAHAVEARAADVPNLAFAGPVYGVDKARMLAEADLLVLPTLAENFAMVVAEALAAGTPVLCTQGAPWPGLEAHGCGWRIEHGVEPLVAALGLTLALDRERLATMGEAGRRWMAAEFDWTGIATAMHSVYAWLGGQGPRPSCVVER